VIEITDVEKASDDSGLLGGYELDEPRPGDTRSFHELTVSGWVTGHAEAAAAVEVRSADAVTGRSLGKSPVGFERADVARAFPHLPAAAKSGFETGVSLLGLPPEFELNVIAWFGERRPATIAVVRGRRTPISTEFDPTLQPLLVTSLGRSGSTWLMGLLSEHPDIVSYRPLEYESRVAASWMQLAHSLTSPGRYLRPVTGTDLHEWHWWLADGPVPERPGDPGLEEFLSGDNVGAIVRFAQGRIDDFYQRVAALQGRSSPRYFAEKFMPDLAAAVTAEVYPNYREILLVRDVRDVICSIHAFNAKRGYPAFGRELATSDEEHLRGPMRDSAAALLESWRRRGDRAIVVRYEDLVRDPHALLGQTLEFLELDASDDTLRRMSAAVARAELLIPELSFHRTTAEATASIGRWKRDLSQALRTLCEETLAEFLETFGYEVEESPSGIETTSPVR